MNHLPMGSTRESSREFLWSSMLALLLAFATGACEKRTIEEIKVLLESREAALAQGDAAGYLEAFSQNYEDELFPWKDGATAIKRRFQSRPWPVVNLETINVQLERGQATATEEFILEADLDGRHHRIQDTQRLRLKREPAGWRIVSGSEVYRFLAGRLEDYNEIGKVLERRAEALEHKNLELYMSVISPGYHRGEKNAAQIREEMAQTFADYDKIRYRVTQRRIWFTGQTAVAQQSFTMEVVLEDEPRTLEGVERLELRKEGQEWKIFQGL